MDRTAVLLGALLTSAALALTGCGASPVADDIPAAASARPSSSPTARADDSTDPGRGSVTPQQAVHRAGLLRADLPRGFGQNVMQQGDLVDGQISLDLCAGSFPSEALRVARHQVYFRARNGDVVSNEMVAYAFGGARQAMAELRHVVATCPSGFRTSPLAGQPRLRTRLTTRPPAPGTQRDSITLDVSMTFQGKGSFGSRTVYQRRGDVVSVLYLHVAGPRRQTLASRLAPLLGSRLGRLGPVTTAATSS